MKKIELYINKCEECPHCSPEFSLHERQKWYCELMDAEIKDVETIPKECPLEDSKKAVDIMKNTI